MWVAPEARTDDGLFDVTIWSGYTLLDFVTKSRKIYDGRHTSMPGTRTLRARRVEARFDAECLLDVDGEAPGRLPATFAIVPGALPFLALSCLRPRPRGPICRPARFRLCSVARRPGATGDSRRPTCTR